MKLFSEANLRYVLVIACLNNKHQKNNHHGNFSPKCVDHSRCITVGAAVAPAGGNVTNLLV